MFFQVEWLRLSFSKRMYTLDPENSISLSDILPINSKIVYIYLYGYNHCLNCKISITITVNRIIIKNISSSV